MEENGPITTEDFLGSVSGEHLEDRVDVDDGVVWVEGVSDDESTRRRLKKISNGEGKRSAIVESEALVLVAAEIRIATIPLHPLQPINEITPRGAPNKFTWITRTELKTLSHELSDNPSGVCIMGNATDQK